jgi:hypothetical protein
MQWAVGTAPALLGAVVLVTLARRARNVTREHRACASALGMSLLLFFLGGAFGVLITGQNVRIPAHYHGSIVGVTLALMGMVYALLPRLGGAAVAHTRGAFWQPILYGTGQMLHIGGLAWSGGYEVLRKTPGAVTESARFAMGVMGLGGLLSIIGGIVFVVVAVRSLSTARHEAAGAS